MNEVADSLDEQLCEARKKLAQYEGIFLKYRSALARTLDATCENTSRMCARCNKHTNCKGIFAHDALCGVLGRDINLFEMM